MNKLNKPKPFYLKKMDTDDEISVVVVEANGNPYAEHRYEQPEIYIRTLGNRSITTELTGKDARKLADWLNKYADWTDGKTPQKKEKK